MAGVRRKRPVGTAESPRPTPDTAGPFLGTHPQELQTKIASRRDTILLRPRVPSPHTGPVPTSVLKAHDCTGRGKKVRRGKRHQTPQKPRKMSRASGAALLPKVPPSKSNFSAAATAPGPRPTRTRRLVEPRPSATQPRTPPETSVNAGRHHGSYRSRSVNWPFGLGDV